MDDPLGADTDSDDELPHGWEERTTPEGWVYYANHLSKITKWEHPKTNKRRVVPSDLPYGWLKREDDQGKVYFVDHINKKTTYVDPRLAFAIDVDLKNGDVFRQRYDASSTTDQILQGSDLSGFVAIVTGASSGIGMETAKSMACHGAKVVMACRNMSKTEEIIKTFKQVRDDVDLVPMELDLASLSSVERFANRFLETKWSLHALILNAAVFQLPWQMTEDDIEMTFAVNHVGHFYLTQLLTPLLLDSAPARIVVLSSESHRFPVGTDPLTLSYLSPPQSQFWPMIQYNRSKLCNVLFSNEMNRRFCHFGLTCNSVHPGNMIYTSLPNTSWLYKSLYFLARPFTKSLKQGAACTVWAATAPELQGRGGLYLNNCFPCQPSELASNRPAAKRLWKLTEDLIKDRSIERL